MAASIDNLVNVNFIKGNTDLLNFGLMLGGSGQHKPFISELEKLIIALYSDGENGALYVPQPIVNGTQALFQGSAGTVPVTADGDPDGLTIDQSPNNNNASQSVSAERPLYNLENGIHSLKGDGVDDNITSQDIVPWLTSSTANAFFAVAFKPNSTETGYIVHCDASGPSQPLQSFALLANFNGDSSFSVGGNVFNNPTEGLSTVIVYLQFNKSTGAGVISWNGGAEQSITVGSASNTVNPMRLFARCGGVNFNGKIYGVVGAEGPVSFDNRRNVMNYLAGLAGVTL